jgi:hypothetical protein
MVGAAAAMFVIPNSPTPAEPAKPSGPPQNAAQAGPPESPAQSAAAQATAPPADVASTPAAATTPSGSGATREAAARPVAIKPTIPRSADGRARMRAAIQARLMSAAENRELPPATMGVYDGQGEPPQVDRRPTEGVMLAAGSFTGDLRNLPQIPVRKRERPERDEPVRELVPLPGAAAREGAAVTAAPAPSAPAPAPSVSFDGMDYTTWGQGHPPDTNGDVGPNHVIESVNTSVAIYTKAGVELAAFSFDTFMSQGTFGNLCDTDNFGDPVVLYDTFEDRWIITDFAFQLSGGSVVFPPGMFQCFAVSKTADPVAGGWNFYSFNTTGGLGDYGKFGIWPDGLYMSFNMFDYAAGGSFQNVRLVAMNKAQMYANAPAVQMVTFNMAPAEFSLLPANARLQTGTPPAGTPNYFTTVKFTNSLSVWKFQVNWAKLALSTLSGPFESVTSALTIFTGANGRVTTPGQMVDALFPRLMMQNQYSNIGGVESLWNSHTVGTSGAPTRAGARYYQVRVTGGTVEANALQSATYSPGGDTLHRWMPSVAVNKNGDMALGFNIANLSTNPSLWYAGRLAADPVNTLPLTDQVLVNGTGAPTSQTRWGDYATMTLDPNGCTFWFIGEYYAVNGSNWKTRIGSFNLGTCTNETTGSITGVVRNAANTPIPNATVKLGVRTTTTNALGEYTFASLPDGTYPTISASLNGYNTSTFTNITVPGGGSAVQNFQLTRPAQSGCFVDTAQADFQADTATDCDLNTTPGSVVLPTSPAINQQNTSTSNTGYLFTATSWAGQTFTPSVSGTVAKAEIQLFCAACSGTTPNITVSLRATSGGLPTGGDLATATITGFNNAAGAYYTATFATPPAVTAFTRYALIFRPVSNPSAGGYYYPFSPSSVYANGDNVYDPGTSSGVNWAADTTADVGFKIHLNSGYAATGTFTSSLKDANPGVGGTVTWGNIGWTANVPGGTTLQFRVAGSNSPDGPFVFVGPDGTAGTSYTNGTPLSQFNGKRYLRYQATLTSGGSSTPEITSVTICYTSTPKPLLDLNADSTGDVFTYNMGTGAWKRAVANGTGGFTEANGSWDPNWTVVPAKFNEDDYTDMFLFNTTSGQWFRMLNNQASGFVTQATGTWWNGWQRHIMDLNGDGLSDVFLYDPASGVWFKSVLSSAVGDFTYSQGGWNPNWEITPMTLNADAFGDMFLINRTTGRWFWVLGQSGPDFSYPVTETWFAGWVFYPGDFNADGLSDLLLHHPATGNYFVARNNGLGTGFLYTSGGWSLGWTPYVADFDADGDQDLFLHAATTGQWFQMLSDGVGGFSVGGSQTWSLGWNIYPTDLNGDGRSDFLLYHPTTGVWYQARNFTLGTFTYSSGNWNPGLTIIVRSPFM